MKKLKNMTDQEIEAILAENVPCFQPTNEVENNSILDIISVLVYEPSTDY